MNKENYTDKAWEGLGKEFGEIDVDKAWNKVHDRIALEDQDLPVLQIRRTDRKVLLLRIAAAVVLLLAIGAGALYMRNTFVNKNVMIASADNQRDVVVTLRDGSKVWLNRNSKLTCDYYLGKETRNVKLTGEAYFEITPDPQRPFIIDAGKARIRVVGTSFNVITSNSENEVEVFVKTGKVMLSNPGGDRSIMLEPGNVGKLGSGGTSSEINHNQNYMAWKTDTLVYDGEKLDVVFSDLKKVFNINIIADDREIKDNPLTMTFFSLPEDTIIQVICNTFSLHYEKDGSVYRLSK